MGFLIQLHLNMFYVLVTAGTICAVWGLVLLIRSRGQPVALPASAEPPAEAAASKAKSSGARPTSADQPAQAGNATGARRGQPPAAPSAAAETPPTRKASTINPLFRSALTVTGYLALLQAALGGLLLLLHNSPRDPLHYVYGIVVLVAIPVAFTYLSGKPERARRDLLFLVIAAVVVAAAAVRAFMTGQ